MAIDKAAIIKRIEELLAKGKSDISDSTHSEMYFGTVTLIELLHGQNSPQLKSLFEARKSIESKMSSPHLSKGHILELTEGSLESLKAEVNTGLTSSIERQTTGELFGDFITMAKKIIEDGYKDAAAVLASAALEDALKRYARLNELDVEDKEMSEVINALKSKELLKGPQAGIVSSFVKLRNKAFHAEWEKIDIADVKSLISFTEEFILKNFS